MTEPIDDKTALIAAETQQVDGSLGHNRESESTSEAQNSRQGDRDIGAADVSEDGGIIEKTSQLSLDPEAGCGQSSSNRTKQEPIWLDIEFCKSDKGERQQQLAIERLRQIEKDSLILNPANWLPEEATIDEIIKEIELREQSERETTNRDSESNHLEEIIRQIKEPEFLPDHMKEYDEMKLEGRGAASRFEPGGCPICKLPIKQGDQLYLGCNHIFHVYCIWDWRRVGENSTCPVCREEFDL